MTGVDEAERNQQDNADTLVRNRENTRTRLLKAGRKLFFSRDYTAISVDMIAREAGFTRAAFYLHFTGKDALVAAMMIAESYKTDPLFERFNHMATTPETIESFVRAFVHSGRDLPAGRLFHIVALQSDAARDAFQENRRRLMAILGDGFPAFRPARDDSHEEQRRAARATLAIVMLEQLALRDAGLASPALLEEMILEMRDRLVSLSRIYRGD
ncbi:TetR/AcrR family transcriptional regulator (plasmid) [Sphingomonas paeninsulae]|uniref:TetR/AcrR family transcriptional regulator n=1 Tax=Sphingomonas paeninsulae TaxID=2319844 RepID=A0A494T7T0_SPHPE|nr:TetR/AcrR family transcriptional regulator [Sphingomonas paeninsulae]AYJ85377.1 TetR/AcrR family transcriptional regulator [Sphingomonas paeninsulae]